MLNKWKKNEKMFVELFHKYQNTGGIYKSRRHELFCSIMSTQSTINDAMWNLSGVIFQPYGYTEIGKFWFSNRTRDKILYQRYAGTKFTIEEATKMWLILEDKYLWGTRRK